MKWLNRFIFMAIAVAVVAFVPAVSHADEYSFSFATPSAIGLLASSGHGMFDVEGGVVTDFTASDFHLGATDEGSMTLIAPNGFAGNDDTFVSTSPYFSFAGISFSADGVDYNIFNDGSGLGITQDSTTGPTLGTDATAIHFTVAPIAPTPEPSSLALLGTSLLGVAGFAKRRFLR